VTLTLVMVRCPEYVTPERRELHGGELSIGRGPDNAWVIADPERLVSKNHCLVAFRAGEWELADLSSNGTFLNRASAPIGRGGVSKLRNGDRIGFGPYELEVSIEETQPVSDIGYAAGDFGDRRADNLDPFAEPSIFGRRDDRRDTDQGLGLSMGASPLLPADFDPLAPDEEPFAGPTQSDHAPAIDSAFRPPPARAAIIPDDWDLDLPGSAPPAPPAQPAPEPPQAQPAAFSAPVAPPAPATAPPVSTPIAAPAPAVADTQLAAAFLRGVGLTDAEMSDPEAMLERVGAVMRAAVSGLRQVLMARASIKDEFRIEQTMIRASGNNPLKFSVDDDDALAMLLGLGRRGTIKPEAAVTEAFRDMRMHELATISAMQAAVRVLLAQFEPAAIEHKAGSGGLGILPGQRKARAWDSFAALHENVTQALSDDFDSVFGKAFARAYEQAIDELTAREIPS
jgi:type VI secretion system FHA domain protein